MPVQEAAELLALDLYRRADGQPITLAMVERRPAELLARRPSLRARAL